MEWILLFICLIGDSQSQVLLVWVSGVSSAIAILAILAFYTSILPFVVMYVWISTSINTCGVRSSCFFLFVLILYWALMYLHPPFEKKMEMIKWSCVLWISYSLLEISPFKETGELLCYSFKEDPCSPHFSSNGVEWKLLVLAPFPMLLTLNVVSILSTYV